MNLPEIVSYEEQAIDTVVSVLNCAREQLGERQTLRQLASSRKLLAPQAKVSLKNLKPPLAKTSEAFLRKTIEQKWVLTDIFKYTINHKGMSQDECAQYYYFEVIFSQPTASYPIPQATASVYFKVKEKLIEPPEKTGVPLMFFRLEGHHTNHDVRYVALTADWLLGILQMKLKLFKRIEEIRLF